MKAADLSAIAPTPEQIREARSVAGLTQKEASKIMFGPDSPRTFQNWEGGVRKMSFGSYVLFLIMTGQLSDAQARAVDP